VKQYGSAEWYGSSQERSGAMSTGSESLKNAPHALRRPLERHPQTNRGERPRVTQTGRAVLSLAAAFETAAVFRRSKPLVMAS